MSVRTFSYSPENMRTVAQAVKRVIEEDNVALEALQRDVLNLSAYAREIQPAVREWLWKDVNAGAIVMALSRYQKQRSEGIVPSLKITDLTLQTGIEEMIFENTSTVDREIAKLGDRQKKRNAYFVAMQGVRETSMLFKSSEAPKISAELKAATKKHLKDLVAVTVRIDDKILEQPNVFYALMKSLIAKQINLIEVLTGLSEVTFVVEQKDQAEVLAAFEKRK